MKNLTSLALFAILATSSAGAQELVFDATSPRGPVVQPGIWRLDGIDPDLPTHDLEPLRRIIGDASVVALGESFHTTGGMYVLKHRIFRYLVETKGFRVFAMETNWQGAEAAERYVQTCQGSSTEVLRSLHTVWQGSEVSDLLDWMCEWNRSHPADRVSFFGFDIQEPWRDGASLVAFLGRIGIPETHEWIAGIRSCEGVTAAHGWGEIPRDRHDACLAALAGVHAHFRVNPGDIERRTSRQDFELARLTLTVLRAWETSIFQFPQNYYSGFSARDAGMAHVFQTLRDMRFPGAKTVIWAANVHIARNRLPRGEVPMGSYLAETLGKDYVSFAITAYRTEVDWTPAGQCGLRQRARGSVEERLHKLGQEALIVDTGRSRFLKRRPHAMGIDSVRPHTDYDGILWLEHSEKMHPLLWPPCS